MIKIHSIPTANILFNGQKLQVFPLRMGIRQGCPLPRLIQHSTGTSSHSNQRRRNERHPNWEGRSKTAIFAYGMVLYIENPKNSTKNPLLELINVFSKVAVYKINI